MRARNALLPFFFLGGGGGGTSERGTRAAALASQLTAGIAFVPSVERRRFITGGTWPAKKSAHAEIVNGNFAVNERFTLHQSKSTCAWSSGLCVRTLGFLTL